MSLWNHRLDQNTNENFDSFCLGPFRAEIIKFFVCILVQTKTSKRHFEINWPLVQYTNVTWNFPNNYWLWINVLYKLLAIFSHYVPSREIDIFADRPTVYMWRIWDWVYLLLLLLFSFFLFNFQYPTYLYIFEEVKHKVCWGQT